MELLIIQLQRMSRLRACTSFISNSLNDILLEFHPSNRVLTGEVIIFQNELLELFKDLIAHSTNPRIDDEDLSVMRDVNIPKEKRLKPRYVVSIITEFLRSLLENQIP